MIGKVSVRALRESHVLGRLLNAARPPMKFCSPLLLPWVLFVPGSVQAADKAMEAYTAGDYARAYKLWRPLADKGEREAQFIIGSMYEHGQGVAVDLAKASDWYRKAASRGHEVA